MKHRFVKRSSTFPANKQVVFEKLQQIQTLQFVSAPYASFEPLDKTGECIWKEGKTFQFRFKVFGVLPFGVHTITVKEFDSSSCSVYTNEHNPHVPVWNHRILLEHINDNTTRYTDEVEVYAGWKTPFVVFWAKRFYAHRQRKWIHLLKP